MRIRYTDPPRIEWEERVDGRWVGRTITVNHRRGATRVARHSEVHPVPTRIMLRPEPLRRCDVRDEIA